MDCKRRPLFPIHRTRPTKTHQKFGHPSVRALVNLLKRENNVYKLEKDTWNSHKKLQDSCDTCKVKTAKTRHFKLTVGSDDFSFNHCLQADHMFLNAGPVLHVNHEATHCFATIFLLNQSSKEIWKSLQSLWFLPHLGPSDHLKFYHGSAYTSTEMRINVPTTVMALLEAPIYSPGSIGVVERYHAPLRAS